MVERDKCYVTVNEKKCSLHREKGVCNIRSAEIFGFSTEVHPEMTVRFQFVGIIRGMVYRNTGKTYGEVS